MKLKFKTWEQLKADGFKAEYALCYLGNKKAPDASFPAHYIENVLGREVDVIGLDEFERGFIRVRVGKHTVKAKHWMFEKSPDLHAIASPVEKKFLSVSNRPIRFTKGVWF